MGYLLCFLLLVTIPSVFMLKLLLVLPLFLDLAFCMFMVRVFLVLVLLLVFVFLQFLPVSLQVGKLFHLVPLVLVLTPLPNHSNLVSTLRDLPYLDSIINNLTPGNVGDVV